MREGAPKLSAPFDRRGLVIASAGKLRYIKPTAVLMKLHSLIRLCLFVSLCFFVSCQTPMPEGIQQARIAMAARIQAEPPGNYFIGRRYFRPNYHFWGYVRRPGQPWSTAQLVMLNENQKLAPDREQINFGYDNNYEYKLYGYFTGDNVYEPASNGVYPEFVLQGYELISTNPVPIFKSQYSGRADNRYLIERPE
jgi:hypothetical protein